jgi:hypothetical protein
MNTKFIGIKEFRQNIADYAKQARTAKTRFVVVNRTTPLFELKPFPEDSTLDSLFAELVTAEKSVKQGRFYTHEEVLKELE